MCYKKKKNHKTRLHHSHSYKVMPGLSITKVQRLLTYEEHSILNKAYQASPCDESVYTPLLLSIQDRHWRLNNKKTACDLVKSIRWVDSNSCE